MDKSRIKSKVYEITSTLIKRLNEELQSMTSDEIICINYSFKPMKKLVCLPL